MSLRPLPIVIMLCATARADSPPPIDEAIRQAAIASKPLVIEFQAEWCQPCKAFAAKTLTDPRVQTALGDVLFVRYDANQESGFDAGMRFRINRYPTFIVVDKQGTERLRHQGAPLGEAGIQRFLELIGNARMVTLEEADVRAALNANTNDVSRRLFAARWFANHNNSRDALAIFEAIGTDKQATAAERMQATTALVRLRRIEQWKRQLIGEKLALVRANLEDADEDDVVLATLGSDLPAAERRKLIGAILAATTTLDRVNGRVYIALAAGENDQALAAAQRIVEWQRDAQHLDTLAECYHVRGEHQRAVDLQNEALALAKGSPLEPQLARNLVRFEVPGGDSREVSRLRLRVKEFWQRVESIDLLADDIDDPSDADSDPTRKIGDKSRDEFYTFFGAQLALEKSIAATCAKDRGTSEQAVAYVELDATGHVKSTKVLLEPEAPKALRECLIREIARANVPSYPRSRRASLSFKFP